MVKKRGNRGWFASRRTLGSRGQASIMIAMMMTTFLLLFTFVVNTGMLVNAKINLQNAADLAAYAGAAVQARQLNQISYLNYEMRRQYKKFLFRYYVLGNLALDGAPRAASNDTAKRKYEVNADNGAKVPLGGGDGVPSVCMIFAANNNICRSQRLGSIQIPPPSQLDNLQNTLIDQLKQIEAAKQDNCRRMSATNKLSLFYWLFNTDPRFEHVDNSTLGPADRMQVNILRGLSSGLGLIPKEALLKLRVGTLTDYVNFPAQKNIDIQKANGFRNSADPAARERTMQAFFSAFNTLGENTFDEAESIQMDELLPGNDSKAALLKLNEVGASFLTLSTFFKLVPSQGNDDSARECDAALEPTPVNERVPLAFVKDPSMLTYYAVRVRGKAKVLFNPFGGSIHLKAYSAAQPFGSRIGPPVTENDFLDPGLQMPQEVRNLVGIIPNLPERFPGLTLTPGGATWNTMGVQGTFNDKFNEEGNSAPAGAIAIDGPAMERAYQAAMMPNPIEAGRYNIPNELVPGHPFQSFFRVNTTGTRKTRIYAFWAPIESPENKVDREELLGRIVDSLTPPLTAQQDPDRPPLSDEQKEFIKKQFSQYLTDLEAGKGEEGESINVVTLVDPFTTRPSNGSDPAPISVGGGLALTDPKGVNSSWNDIRDGNLEGQGGRTGYSVKFVAFRHLIARTIRVNGQDTPTTELPVDSEAQEDELPGIGH